MSYRAEREPVTQTPGIAENRAAWFYGGVLVVLNFLPLGMANRMWRGDWAYFVGAGKTVGTNDLLGQRHIAWEVAHAIHLTLPWVYPPAFAWFYRPFAHISLSVGFWVNAVGMLAACIAAALIAARIYALPSGLAVLAVLAWGPNLRSIWGGQNANVALLFSMLCVLALVRARPITVGVTVGALLFKPTDAVGFVITALARRQWLVLAVVGGCGMAWYLSSVAATAGDWLWPYHDAVFTYH